MIDTVAMNCDEITDLIYDIRDGKVRNEDVNWSFYKPKEESNNIINKECELCRRYGIEKGICPNCGAKILNGEGVI